MTVFLISISSIAGWTAAQIIGWGPDSESEPLPETKLVDIDDFVADVEASRESFMLKRLEPETINSELADPIPLSPPFFDPSQGRG